MVCNVGVMQTPWVSCPDIPPGSIGWRMGRGEEAYIAFYRSFSDLVPEQRDEFAQRNPEPPGWEGLYARITARPWPNT